MNKILFCLLVFVLGSQNTAFAQADKKYAQRIEKLLFFEKSTLKDTVHFSEVLRGTNEELDKRIQKAQKIKQNPDSITTKTIDLLKSMKALANDSITFKLNDVIRKLIDLNTDSITSTEQAVYGLDLVILSDEVGDDFYAKLTYLFIESKEVVDGINEFREENDLTVAFKEKDPSESFWNQYLKYFFYDVEKMNSEFEAKEKEIALHFEKEAPKLYLEQLHRFEFIKGILHYNDKALRQGQKLENIKEILGTDYIETNQEDQNSYGVIRYTNIPLEIGFENGVVAYFDILFKPPTDDDVSNFSFLNEDYVKLENHYFNKEYSSLQSLVPKIREDTQRAFVIGNSSLSGIGDKFVCYDDPDDTTYNQSTDVDRHFYLFLDISESEIKTIYYEED